MTAGEVCVLTPYRTDGTSEEYGTAPYRAEVAGWFRSLGLDFTWWPVHLQNVDETIEALIGRIRSRAGIVFNLCDGIEIDGFPGISVVRSLEAHEVPFTGADSSFYATSSSKIEMKRRFTSAAVPCPPGFFIEDFRSPGIGIDIGALTSAVGFPCIVKLDLASNGLGLTRSSVAQSPPALLAQLDRFHQDPIPGAADLRQYGLFAEKFVPGREFTVLVVTDPESPSGMHVYPAVEIRYHSATPLAERILFLGYRDATVPHSASEPHCTYVPAAEELQLRAMPLAGDAFQAVGGIGYGRVDMRMDELTGNLFVLEVNANCSLSVDEPTIMRGLEAARGSISDLIAKILRAGWHRRR